MSADKTITTETKQYSQRSNTFKQIVNRMWGNRPKGLAFKKFRNNLRRQYAKA